MPPGRSQVKAMERLAKILAVLDNAGVVGATADKLVEIGEYGGDEKNVKDQLGLDLKRLRSQGWQIRNIAGAGADARYRMDGGDNRLQVRLKEPQLAALQRAVILAQRSDLAKRLGVKPEALPQGIGVDVVPKSESAELSLCHHAVQLGSRVFFTYKGTPRVVHPGSVRFQNYRWYLSGIEEGFDFVKHFIVADMSDLSLDKPGTGDEVPGIGKIPLHPLRWAIDEPTPVTVRTTPEYVPDVVRWLNEPDSQNAHDGVVDMRFTVTHRAAFRARVYILGPRVTLADGGDVHDELVDELRTMLGA